jgi:hypothetical protein
LLFQELEGNNSKNQPNWMPGYETVPLPGSTN